MGGIACKRCQGTDYVKRGTVRNLQRYQCKACGCNFANTPPCGKPPGMKALALMLYAMGNMSFCSIARRLGVSDVAVLKWVRNEARRLRPCCTDGARKRGDADFTWVYAIRT
jgi:transposase